MQCSCVTEHVANTKFLLCELCGSVFENSWQRKEETASADALNHGSLALG